MKTTTLTIAAGALLVAFGAIFALQGFGVLAGSAMSGATLWAVLGPVIAVGGVLLVLIGLRGRRSAG